VAAQGRYGATPLHFSVTWGFEGVSKVLLHSGADGEATDDIGASPEDRARARPHLEVQPPLRAPPLFSRAIVFCERSSILVYIWPLNHG